MTDKIVIPQERIDAFSKKNNIIPLSPYPDDIEVVSLGEIEPKNQPWLWNNIIPLCAFTLFAGVGGLGKSQLLAFIAAHVSNGLPFSAGGIEHQLPKGSVIILSCEDSLEYALAPRLLCLGADPSKVHIVKAVSNAAQPLKKRLMALDQDLYLLRQTIEKLGDVRLIIIDPIINFIGKTKDYINTEVSNFLYSLTAIGEEFNLAIILNKHLRKKDSASAASAIDEIAGSSAWSTTARQVWILARDHEDKKKILFLDGKSNIKEQMSGMAFKISSAQVFNSLNHVVKTSRINWLDEIVNVSADDAVSEERYEKSKTQICVDFIYTYLKENGQSVIKHIEEAALIAGIKSRTFDRAVQIIKKEGDVKITNGVYPNKCWELKD